jgi:hypothetical protein
MAHLIKTKQALGSPRRQKPAKDSGMSNILSTNCEDDEEKYY